LKSFVAIAYAADPKHPTTDAEIPIAKLYSSSRDTQLCSRSPSFLSSNLVPGRFLHSYATSKKKDLLKPKTKQNRNNKNLYKYCSHSYWYRKSKIPKQQTQCMRVKKIGKRTPRKNSSRESRTERERDVHERNVDRYKIFAQKDYCKNSARKKILFENNTEEKKPNTNAAACN
jgi:hypothetical protein